MILIISFFNKLHILSIMKSSLAVRFESRRLWMAEEISPSDLTGCCTQGLTVSYTMEPLNILAQKKEGPRSPYQRS